MKLRQKIVAGLASVAVITGIGVAAAESASAYPRTPYRGEACWAFSYETHATYYRVFERTFDNYYTCGYKVTKRLNPHFGILDTESPIVLTKIRRY
jgi:hypothetical protein